MLRILRAFIWLRWRVLVNSLEHGGRDAMERFSLAFEQLKSTIVLLLMAPSALALLVVGIYAGRLLAAGELRVVPFDLLRFLLAAACAFAIVGPILLPAGERTNAVRLLLLPIPRGMLYAGQVVSALADPWIVLVVAAVIGLPAGLATGGHASGALVAAAGGVLLLGVLAGLTLSMTGIVHLLARNRRRGELLALLFILLVPLVGLLPGLLDSERRVRARADPGGRQERSTRPERWARVERSVVAATPSELFATAIRREARGESAAAARSLLALAATAAVLHGIAFAAFVRVLSSPGTIRSAHRSAGGRQAAWQVPGLSQQASAVAVNQLRLALRTPRGRAIVLSPVVLFVVFAAFLFRGGSQVEFGFVRLDGGLGVATFAGFVSLLAIVPLAMNQFAIDGAGFTLLMLAPLDTRTVLRGKAIGNALAAAIPATFCFVAAMVMFPSGSAALWASIPLGLIATYLLVAPAAALLSAIFPRAVDLNSVGGGSNAHGAAGLLGTLAFAAAGAPCLLLVLLATRYFERPVLAPVFLIGWLVACGAVVPVLFRLAEMTFDRRRENLGMV